MPVVVAVLPKSMCKISSVPPPLESLMTISKLNLIRDIKSTNTLHQVFSFFKKLKATLTANVSDAILRAIISGFDYLQP